MHHQRGQMTDEDALKILNANRAPSTPKYTIEDARKLLARLAVLADVVLEVARSIPLEERRAMMRHWKAEDAPDDAGEQLTP